jgi:hypothetical protein
MTAPASPNSATGPAIKLNLATRKFPFGHEAQKEAVKAFPKRQQPSLCDAPPAPQNPFDVSNGILPRRFAAQ